LVDFSIAGKPVRRKEKFLLPRLTGFPAKKNKYNTQFYQGNFLKTVKRSIISINNKIAAAIAKG
jgi:hypothetical protein